MLNRIDYPVIDGLRVLAFLLVFFGHFSIFIPSPFLQAMGWTGVPLFFLISGFLLSRILVTEYRQTGQINLKKYFIRRILRIWPLYFFYLMVLVILCLFVYQIGISWFRLGGTILFIDNWISAFSIYNFNFATAHLWSISLEEQFYGGLPFLLILLLPKSNYRRTFYLFAGFLLLFVLRLIALQLDLKYPFIYTTPLGGDCFLAGVVMGISFDEKKKKLPAGGLAVAGLGILVFLYLFVPPKESNGYHQLFLYPALALAYSAILAGALQSRNRIFLLLFTNRVTRYLGRISFGLYIFHYGVLLHLNYFFRHQHPEIPVEWSLPSSLAITTLLALMSYELLEKPFLRLKQKFTVIRNYRLQ